MSLPITEILIQRQLNHWNRLRAFLQEKGAEVPAPAPVITVSRQAGSGGRTLALQLADRLGLQLQDQSLMERIASDRNLNRSLLEDLDEQEIRQSELWVKGVLNRRIFLRNEFHAALVQVITRLAARGGVVFLGRGAHLVLGANASLRVRLVASRQVRQERLRQRFELSRAEARALMDETDRRRAEFERRLFGAEPGLAENHDLTLNTDRLTPEQVLELVLLGLLARRTAAAATAGVRSGEG